MTLSSDEWLYLALLLGLDYGYAYLPGVVARIVSGSEEAR